MPKIIFYDDVKQYIESFDYTLLSDTYKNVKTKLKVRCNKGHEYEVTFNHFKSGNRCPICAGKTRLSYDDVKQYIENQGYTLLSDTYKNVKTKLKVRCNKGHEYETTFNYFQQGNRCPVCAGNTRLSYDDVKQYIESFDYTLLSDTYKNVKTKLKVRCNKGHEYEVKFYSFKNGNRCPVCNGNKKYSYDDVKQYIESFGYTLLSKVYKNIDSKLKLKCPKGHEYEVIFYNFKNRNSRCPVCFANLSQSKAEKEVAEFVKGLLYDKTVIYNDRTQIINPLTGWNLELDIWVPELKMAIEYNGTYWHNLSESIEKDKIKKKQCKEKGIRLLIVEEEKWKEDKQFEMKKIEHWIRDLL